MIDPGTASTAISVGSKIFGGLFGGKSKKKAAKKAAKAQQAAALRQEALAREYDARTQKQTEPYRAYGENSTNKLSDYLGIDSVSNDYKTADSDYSTAKANYDRLAGAPKANRRRDQASLDNQIANAKEALDASQSKLSGVTKNNARSESFGSLLKPYKDNGPYVDNSQFDNRQFVDNSQFENRQFVDNSKFENRQFVDNSKFENRQFVDSNPITSAQNADLLQSSITPETLRSFTENDLNNDVVYNKGLQFGLDEGRKGLNNRALAMGSFDSGAALKELTRYGNDYGETKAAGAQQRFMGDKAFSFDARQNDKNFRLGALTNDRNFRYGDFTDSKNFDYNKYSQDKDFNYNTFSDSKNFDYNKSTQDKNFNYNTFNDAKNFDYNKFTQDRNFNFDAFNTSKAFDYNKFNQDRAFNYGNFTDNRNFNENSYNNNRTFTLGALTGGVGTGQTAVGQSAGAMGTALGAKTDAISGGANAKSAGLIRQGDNKANMFGQFADALGNTFGDFNKGGIYGGGFDERGGYSGSRRSPTYGNNSSYGIQLPPLNTSKIWG